MSWHGRQVVAHLDAAELEIERREEASYWRRFANRLTPAEKARIKGESYNSIRRPVRPSFVAGAWLEVTKKLHVQIADVVPYKGRYRIRIAGVRDFRGSGGSPFKTYGEDVTSMKFTLAISGDHHPNPPEPHGPGEVWLKRFAAEARLKEADQRREAIEG